MAALPYPPIADGFLAMFGCSLANVVWENASAGYFGIIVPVHTGAPPSQFTLPERPLPQPVLRVSVVELPTTLDIPSIPAEERGPNPPMCQHGEAAICRIVGRPDSPNVGRSYFVCGHRGGGNGRCAFFRWADETEMFSRTQPRSSMTAGDVRGATASVRPEEQLSAWSGLKQGTEEWLRLRACRTQAPHVRTPGRVTASNFGSAHRTNSLYGKTGSGTPTMLRLSLFFYCWCLLYPLCPLCRISTAAVSSGV
jgi:hypothetical protein